MQSRRRRKYRYAAPVGLLTIALVAAGVIAIVWLLLSLTMKMLDNEGDVNELERIIRPVVMFDPAPFDHPSEVDMTNLLRFSMWTALTGDKRSSYEYNEYGELVVPASDLDVACARLFGGEVELVHATFDDYETVYHFDGENKYSIPIAAALYVYTPEVERVERVGEYYRLLVAYIPPGDAWTTNYSGERNRAEPEKEMYYYMLHGDDGYYLAKVEDIIDVEQEEVPPTEEDQLAAAELEASRGGEESLPEEQESQPEESPGGDGESGGADPEEDQPGENSEDPDGGE